MLDARRWAEIRRMKEVEGLSIHEIVRRTGHDRNTVRRALRREGPPRYQRPPRPSKLDPVKDEIHRLLQSDPRIPGKRIRELIEELGYEGGKTILDDYLRDVRPLFERRRTYQRTVYRPGELVLVRPLGTARRDPGRPWPGSSRLGRDLRAWLVARDRRCAGLLQGVGRHRVWDDALPGWRRRDARDAGLGSRGRDPCRRWPAHRRVCRLLRSAGGRLADPRGARPAGQGRAGALAPLHAHQLRAGPQLRQRA